MFVLSLNLNAGLTGLIQLVILYVQESPIQLATMILFIVMW